MTLLVVSPDLSGVKMAVLAAGVAACAYCHYVFIRDARRKQAALKLRVIELQYWL